MALQTTRHNPHCDRHRTVSDRAVGRLNVCDIARLRRALGAPDGRRGECADLTLHEVDVDRIAAVRHGDAVLGVRHCRFRDPDPRPERIGRERLRGRKSVD